MNAITKTPLSTPFRWAEPKDSRRLAELMNIAGEGIPYFLWSESCSQGQDPMDVGSEWAKREEGNFSWRNTLVVEQDHQVVAMMLGYPLTASESPEDMAEIPAVVRPFLELEPLAAGSYYINALAVLPAYRGRGWGGWLLKLAHRIARANHCKAASLTVFEQNEKAVQIYLNNGYQVVDQRPAVPHECHPYNGQIILMSRRVEER